jgi:hypothetical protein
MKSTEVVLLSLFVFIVLGSILFISKLWLSPPLQNRSLFKCPSGQKCQRGNVTTLPKENLSTAQKKLSPDLLPLTDSRDLPIGMTPDAQELQMEQNPQLIHVAGTGNTLVYVYSKTSENADITPINSFVWNVTNTDPANHLVVAGVDVNYLINLASLASVQLIQSVSPPVTGRDKEV